ncbi:MAG: hypothetical protein WC306_00290 [Candidatus Paceibacterota bacterium]|jgi:hypothetical protein
MLKKFYLYSNVFAWGLVFFLIGNYVFGWTTPTESPPGGNVVLDTGATPAGSTGYIQFNDAGNLGADSALFWDNTNKSLGIGTTTPETAKLKIVGGVLDMTTQKITNLATPTDDSDAATKGYVDAASHFSVCTLRFYSSNCPTDFTKVAETNTSFTYSGYSIDYWTFGRDYVYRFNTNFNSYTGYAMLLVDNSAYDMYSWNVNGTETHYFCCR